MAAIDHLVYATPDLQDTVAHLQRVWAIDLVPGGPHIGRGTRNYLAGLGNGTYLEVIGPDTDQPTPKAPRPFGVDDLAAAELVAWCARPNLPLASVVESVKVVDGDLGVVMSMSRQRPDGVLLDWELTVAPLRSDHGVIPFCIDWLASEHPTTSLSGGTRLDRLELSHFEPSRVRAILSAIGGFDVVVHEGAPHLTALLTTPNGELTLR